MKRAFLMLPLLGLTACMVGGYTSAAVVWSEPVEYVYVEPMDRVVVISREVLISNGYTVYRVTSYNGGRVLWARRGDNEMVRIFVSPSGGYVGVRGVIEVRDHDRGRHRGWERRGSPNRVLAAINGKLKRRNDRDDHDRGRGR